MKPTRNKTPEPQSHPPKCAHCLVELPDMLSFCVSINGGFDQRFLCTDCGNDMEEKSSNEGYWEAYSVIEDTKSDTISLPPDEFATQINHEDHPSDGESMEKRIKCRLCPKVFVSVKQRKEHQNATHFNPDTGKYRCPVCAYEIKQISNLIAHMIRHSGSFPTTCEVCGKGFAHKAFLEKHQRCHQTDRQFMCPVCSKGFKYKHGLLQHELIHANLKPYACEVCDKRFRDLSDLRRHKYSHGLGEKRFQCAVCQKEFYDSKWLKQHAKIHDREPIKI